jgi:hypothetical protein
MNTVIDELKNYWMRAGVKFRPPASEDSVRDFESRYGVVMPPELRDYFFTFDGLEDEEWDNDMISFWPLHRVGNAPEVLGRHGGLPDYRAIVQTLPHSESYFVFADYLCFSHVYAFQLTKVPSKKSPVIWIGSGDSFGKLANSFSDFLKKYLLSPGDLNNAVLTLPIPTHHERKAE